MKNTYNIKSYKANHFQLVAQSPSIFSSFFFLIILRVLYIYVTSYLSLITHSQTVKNVSLLNTSLRFPLQLSFSLIISLSPLPAHISPSHYNH